jgi:hypothetical protein
VEQDECNRLIIIILGAGTNLSEKAVFLIDLYPGCVGGAILLIQPIIMSRLPAEIL